MIQDLTHWDTVAAAFYGLIRRQKGRCRIVSSISRSYRKPPTHALVGVVEAEREGNTVRGDTRCYLVGPLLQVDGAFIAAPIDRRPK